MRILSVIGESYKTIMNQDMPPKLGNYIKTINKAIN